MARNPVFTQQHIAAVVRLIRGWDGDKIRWVDVCEAAGNLIGFTPSRQGLSRHEAILVAFQSKQESLRIGGHHQPVPSSLAIAAKRIAGLQAKNRELERRIRDLNERFRTWQYNAHVRNISEEELDRPLPVVTKGVGEAEIDDDGHVR